jgi:cell division inhibitor SepF
VDGPTTTLAAEERTMSNWMKNTRTWLGLGNEPYYEDEYGEPEDEYYEDEDYDDEPLEPQRAARPAPARSSARSTVRSVPSARGGEDWDEGDGGVRVINAPAPEPENRGVVRPLPSSAKPHVVSPSSFNDVQQVADRFKRDQPVIINLQGVDRDLSRRLIDFASGLCYGLEGDMERVADQVFLLTPRGAQVSDDDRRRLREGGLVDDER